MIATLTQEAAQALRRHAEKGWPEEVCGFLIGAEKRVRVALVAPNSWLEAGGTTRRHRFAIAPTEYLAADKDARNRGESIIGFYHSHPDAPAVPSGYDLGFAQETFPGYLHLIVSVRQGQADEMTCWVLQDDGAAFQAVPLTEGEFE